MFTRICITTCSGLAAPTYTRYSTVHSPVTTSDRELSCVPKASRSALTVTRLVAL